MSVLIKDMEMPKKCGECDIYVCYRTWHGDSGDEFCGLTKKSVKYKTKPEWCPLSEVPERKTGEWIGTEYDGYADGNPVYYEWKCSECGCVIEEEGRPTYNYCPNCGADMRGEQDE